VSLRDDVLPIINAGWQTVQDLGFAPATVTVRTATWSSGEVGTGTATYSDLLLSPNPLVEEKDEGRKLVVGPIQPSHSGGGYTFAQLRPTMSAGQEFYYVITGVNGTHNYELMSIDSTSPSGLFVEYMLNLAPLTRTTPF
jgi:hypothetical protein